MTAPARHLGLQPGFRQLPPLELYDLLAPVGHHPRGSTVSRQTLEKHGYQVYPGLSTERHFASAATQCTFAALTMCRSRYPSASRQLRHRA